MPPDPKSRRPLGPILRALVEIGFIIFLFYSNLLMGSLNRASGQTKTPGAVPYDVLTPPTSPSAFAVAPFIGYLVVEFLRKKTLAAKAFLSFRSVRPPGRMRRDRLPADSLTC